MTIVCDCCGGIAHDEDKQNLDREPTHQCQECREGNHTEKFDGHCDSWGYYHGWDEIKRSTDVDKEESK